MIQNFFRGKIIRFLICGVITAAFNVLLLAAIIELLGVKTPVGRNVANVFSIEVSLFFSFFVYRAWVWSAERSTTRDMLFRQLPLYHLSVATTTLSRSFLIFPILDWLKVHYVINTLFGILVGSIANYVISDKWVFRARKTNQ